jgi:hypothetical protein
MKWCDMIWGEYGKKSVEIEGHHFGWENEEEWNRW